MADTNVISADEARRLFAYDEQTGHITRRVRTGVTTYVGEKVGSADMHGYWTVRVNRRSYKLHRLAWLIVHGKWPDGDIDHINGNRRDNRIENLRDVPRGVNLQNMRMPKNNNSTGVLGVYPDGAKFYARISINNKSKHLGTFGTVDEARAAYVAAKRQLHPGSML